MAISDVSDSIYEFTQQQSCSPIATANFINAIEVSSLHSFAQSKSQHVLNIPCLENFVPT
jgi:hypothetical protein